MSNVDVQKLRRLLANATVSPWRHETKEQLGENEAVLGELHRVVCDFYTDETPGVCGDYSHDGDWFLTDDDADLIAELRNEAPAMLDEIERLRAENHKLFGAGVDLASEIERLRAENERMRASLDGSKKLAIAAVDGTECDGVDYHSRFCRRCSAQAVVDFLNSALEAK